ncbi:MAG: hypothetical protein RSB10_01125 [Clostridia bacterium]
MFKLSSEAKKYLPATIFVTFLTIFLVANPQKYISSISDGFVLFATNVLPALFPFFFFSKLLTGLGLGEIVGALFAKPAKLLYHAPPSAGYIFFLSILSGYPVGSKIVADACASGIVTQSQAKKMITFCSTSGPLFVIGTVGTLMLGSPKYGYVLMFCHFFGAIVNGLFYRKKEKNALPCREFSTQKTADLLGSSITNSVISVLVVGGYIAIFSMIIDVLGDIKLIDTLALCVGKLLALCHQPTALARGIVLSLLEITRGCKEFALCGVDIVTILPYIGGALAFGGGCIALQSMTFLSTCGVKTSYFLLSKLTQSLTTFAITFAIAQLL